MQTTTPITTSTLIQYASLQDVERMIDKAVQKRMDEFYERIRDKPPALIKRKVAAERLGVSLPTLDQYAKHGFLKITHLGGRVYFDEAEVEAYRQKNSK